MVRNPRVVFLYGLLLAAGSVALGGGIAPGVHLSAGSMSSLSTGAVDAGDGGRLAGSASDSSGSAPGIPTATTLAGSADIEAATLEGARSPRGPRPSRDALERSVR